MKKKELEIMHLSGPAPTPDYFTDCKVVPSVFAQKGVIYLVAGTQVICSAVDYDETVKFVEEQKRIANTKLYRSLK